MFSAQSDGAGMPVPRAGCGMPVAAFCCAALFFAKFMIFDIVWCRASSFAPFAYPATYLSAAFVSMLLALPLMFGAARGAVVAELLLCDMFLTSNLMYFRTYFTSIPAGSYLLVGNLCDFAGSVIESVRWSDALFPLSSIAAALVLYLRGPAVPKPRGRLAYAAVMCLCCASLMLSVLAGGGFRKSYAAMLTHRQLSATPKYTLFGTLLYEALDRPPQIDDSLSAAIEQFAEAPDGICRTDVPRTVVVLFLESFESWLLGQSLEGVELTPNLNRLLRGDSVLFVPHVLTQVRGGRSIDAQLLLSAGMLPPKDGCFSSQHPHAHYMTLVGAFRQHWPDAQAYAFTPDRPTVWNQKVVARSFGFDRLLDRSDFSRDTLTGTGDRARLADGPFLAECLAKFDALDDVPLWLQCITYSGHSPFDIPDNLKRVRFSKNIPPLLRNYAEAACYTDRAVGAFVDSLRSRPRFADAMIVITGDHEALGAQRAELAANRACCGVVSGQCFTPLIVLNSPVGMRYEPVIGQIDMYPTILDLLGLCRWQWRGLGRSVLCDEAPCGALNPVMEAVGDMTPQQRQRQEQAWQLSDVMIRGDWFGRRSP